MKKLISLFVIMLALTMMSFSQTPEKLYEKYKGNDDVTTIVLNEGLFKMVNGMEIDVHEDVNGIIDKLDKMIVLSSEKINFMKEVDLSKYDELINVNEGDEVVKIYGNVIDERIKELVIVTQELKESNLIFIKGDLRLEDLKKITKE